MGQTIQQRQLKVWAEIEKHPPVTDCKECGRELLGSSETDLGICDTCNYGDAV